MQRLSRLHKLRCQEYEYLFILLCDKYWLKSNDVQKIASDFAAGIGPHGTVFTSFPEKLTENQREILAKKWPKEILIKIQNFGSPKLLVIDKDFAAFDPNTDDFAIVEFERIGGLECGLSMMEKILHSGHNLFTWYRELQSRREPELSVAAKAEQHTIQSTVQGITTTEPTQAHKKPGRKRDPDAENRRKEIMTALKPQNNRDLRKLMDPGVRHRLYDTFDREGIPLIKSEDYKDIGKWSDLKREENEYQIADLNAAYYLIKDMRRNLSRLKKTSSYRVIR